jgi:hypothetical protein
MLAFVGYFLLTVSWILILILNILKLIRNTRVPKLSSKWTRLKAT